MSQLSSTDNKVVVLQMNPHENIQRTQVHRTSMVNANQHAWHANHYTETKHSNSSLYHCAAKSWSEPLLQFSIYHLVSSHIPCQSNQMPYVKGIKTKPLFQLWPYHAMHYFYETAFIADTSITT